MTPRKRAALALLGAILFGIFAVSRYSQAQAHLHKFRWTLWSKPIQLVSGERIGATLTPMLTTTYLSDSAGHQAATTLRIRSFATLAGPLMSHLVAQPQRRICEQGFKQSPLMADASVQQRRSGFTRARWVKATVTYPSERS